MAQDTDPVPYHRTLQAKKPHQRFLIHTSGPLFNLISGVLSFFYLYCSTESIPSVLDLYPESSIISVHFFVGIFFYLSLLMCFFNLIPFKKFDGGVFISETKALKKVGS